MVGMRYNLDRSKCFYVTLLDLAEPTKPHREISNIHVLSTRHEQKREEQTNKKIGFHVKQVQTEHQSSIDFLSFYHSCLSVASFHCDF